ncbi:hypothetical protein ES703_86720 [subsurface metagenome]
MEEIPYKKAYTMRAVGEGGLNTTVTIPPEVIRREAEKRGLTVDEFRERFIAIAQYDNIEGVLYTFEEKPAVNSKP